MSELIQSVPTSSTFLRAPSVLVMSDRLLTLAQEADRAGYSATAERLLHLAHDVFDDKQRGDKRLIN